MFCENCGAEITEGQPFCSQCGTAQTSSEASSSGFPTTPTLPMKWYKYLIYFHLFAGAALNLFNAYRYFTGKIYSLGTNGEITADLVYSIYGALRPLDIICGILVLGVAALMIVTRFKLSGYKADALKFVIITYTLSTLLNVFYGLAFSVITGVPINIASLVGVAIGGAIMIFPNLRYFGRRKDLFIN